jgi:hypothetical protein
VLRSHSSGNETESPGLGKGSRSEPGAELQFTIQLAVKTRSTGFEVAGASTGLQTLDVKCDQARDETCSHAGDLTMKETRSNRDPCWEPGTGPWLTFATDSELPTFLFRPPSARQRRRKKSDTGSSNPRSREEPFLDPPGPCPAFGRPGSPERDCGPGCQSRHRRELSMPRTQCSALRARLGSSGKSRAQAQARRTRMSHSSRIQPPA